MPWALFIILQLAWPSGIAGGHTPGGFIHVLLVLASITAVIKLVQDRRQHVVTVETNR
jgi:hypothetical protein